jgi:hypothetical protein
MFDSLAHLIFPRVSLGWAFWDEDEVGSTAEAKLRQKILEFMNSKPT